VHINLQRGGMSKQAISTQLAVTRVTNSCVLLELNGHTILTDPWFTERWHLHRAEPLGLTVDDLPRLTAIVASHPVPNHWDLRALRAYHHKSAPRVFVATPRMERQARKLGYPAVEHLRWGETRQVTPGLTIQSVRSGQTVLFRNNAYLLTSGELSVFFGGEISDVAMVKGHRSDVALLPVNGLRIAAGPQLVMGPGQALAAATMLGAQVLVPIHDAHAQDPLYFMIRRHGSARDAEALALADPTGPTVVRLPPGQRWEFHSSSGFRCG
jgi:L-ascorbate metabolism protein UlaG (beta-lactamase superfamily)